MAKEPKVLIVMLNWNGLEDTLACLTSLEEVSYSNFQTLVVDNGSKGNEAATIAKAFPDVALIKNKNNLGFTGGCNQGIDYAIQKGIDYVLLLNNDTVVTPDFLGKLVSSYENLPDAGAVSPIICYADKKHIWFAGGQIKFGITRHFKKGEIYKKSSLPKAPFKSGFVPGTAMLMSVQRIKEVGKLDDRLFAYFEDVDWCDRARSLGYFPYVVPGSLIYHKKSASTGGGGRQRFGKVPAYYIARNSLIVATELSLSKKLSYLIAQAFIKLPLSLLVLIKPVAWPSYVRGFFIGVRTLFIGKVAQKEN